MSWTGILTGVFCKLYDDLVIDNSVLKDERAIVGLRTALVTVATLYLASDFWTAVAFTFGVVVTFFSDPAAYSSPHEQSFLAMIVFILIASWSRRKSVSVADILLVVAGAAMIVFEPHVFPEETSLVKFIVRGAVAFISLGGMFLPESLALTRSLFSFIFGYFGTSSVIQRLTLSGLLWLDGTELPGHVSNKGNSQHEEGSVGHNVNPTTSRPPVRVPDKNLPELPRTVNPEGSPVGHSGEQPRKEDSRQAVNQ